MKLYIDDLFGSQVGISPLVPKGLVGTSFVIDSGVVNVSYVAGTGLNITPIPFWNSPVSNRYYIQQCFFCLTGNWTSTFATQVATIEIVQTSASGDIILAGATGFGTTVNFSGGAYNLGVGVKTIWGVHSNERMYTPGFNDDSNAAGMSIDNTTGCMVVPYTGRVMGGNPCEIKMSVSHDNNTSGPMRVWVIGTMLETP